jgi:hypothetical protein
MPTTRQLVSNLEEGGGLRVLKAEQQVEEERLCRRLKLSYQQTFQELKGRRF